MDSGFRIHDDIHTHFADMKTGSKKTRFIIMKPYKELEMVKIECMFEKTEDQRKDCDELFSTLSDSEGCYILLDLTVNTKSGSSKDQLIYITWSPDSSNVNARTLIASGHFGLSRALQASLSCVTIQANDREDISYEQLMIKGMK